MVNPFTIYRDISRLQQDVLYPLYTMHEKQEMSDHAWLLRMTGEVIEKNRSFIEDLAASTLVALVFKVVVMLGGAGGLREDDFDRFTSYVNAGGIKAMVKMLLAVDKEQMFLRELKTLPRENRENAPLMLHKAVQLHQDFIEGFFREQYGSLANTPAKLRDNFKKSSAFISELAELAGREN